MPAACTQWEGIEVQNIQEKSDVGQVIYLGDFSATRCLSVGRIWRVWNQTGETVTFFPIPFIFSLVGKEVEKFPGCRTVRQMGDPLSAVGRAMRPMMRQVSDVAQGLPIRSSLGVVEWVSRQVLISMIFMPRRCIKSPGSGI